MSVEKKKYPSALPTNWPSREEASRKSQNQLSSTGKVDVYYYRYVPYFKHLFKTLYYNNIYILYIVYVQYIRIDKNLYIFYVDYNDVRTFTIAYSNLIYIYDILYLFFSRGVRNDASLVPPIRQTASIFKQPVTIYKTQEGKVKDIKHGNQEKPKQVSIYYTYFYYYLFFLCTYTY